MDRKRALHLLSHIPLGTVVSVLDDPDNADRALVGGFAGLGLLDGEDTIKVSLKAGQGAQMLLDHAIAVVIDLR